MHLGHVCDGILLITCLKSGLISVHTWFPRLKFHVLTLVMAEVAVAAAPNTCREVFSASLHVILIVSFNIASGAVLDTTRYLRHPYRADRYDVEYEKSSFVEIQL